MLAAGMPWSWISEGDGFSVKGLPTRYGSLDFMIKARGTEAIEVEVGGAFSLPPGGLTIVPPLPASAREDVHLKVESLPFRGKLRF